MYGGLDLGNMAGALRATGQNLELADQLDQQMGASSAAQATPTQAPPAPNPLGDPGTMNQALEVTGSSFRLPDEDVSAEPEQEAPAWAQAVDKYSKMLPAASPRQQSTGPDDGTTKYPGIANSPAAGLVKKAASAVAAYFTGGASALAMNLGGQVLSQKNPQAGAALGAVSKGMGWGG